MARSASSADNPVLRGTPEGKAMQFSLRTTFFFGAINPRGMSAADDSRILRFEMLMHANDEDVARRLIVEEQHFANRGPDWCGYMIGHTALIRPTIAAFTKVMPGIDGRHRLNITTLMVGAFVALNGRVPSEAEAEQWADEFKDSVTNHAEALERDDATEALQHLLSHEVGDDTLGYKLSRLLTDETIFFRVDKQEPLEPITGPLLRIFDMRLIREGDRAEWYIRNRSPGVEKAFGGTRWADYAWMSALRKLPGAQTSNAYFAGAGGKCRVLVLPLSSIKEESDPRQKI